jgi:hypothetical protein
MRHNRLLILGGFLMGAMGATLFAGCSGSSGNNGGGGGSSAGGGASGTGGRGAGGSSMDAGMDRGSSVDTGTDTSGTGGSSADAHGDVATDKGADTGSSDSSADMAVDTPVDTGHDAGGPCVTSYGAGNPVQFAFDGGANGGWTVFQTHYTGNPDPLFTRSLAASFTEGYSCTGALLEALNFASYGQSGAIEYFYGVSPNGANWTGYKALHAWIKMETSDPSEVSGVIFYMKSGGQSFYQSAFAAASSLADWHEVVIDLTRAPSNGTGVMINDVQLIGFETFLNATPAVGAPATPSQVLVLADDIWLEAAAAPDAGASDAGDAGGQ